MTIPSYATPEFILPPVPGDYQVLPPLPTADEWGQRLALRLLEQRVLTDSVDWCRAAIQAAAELRAARLGHPLPFGVATAPDFSFPATDAFPRRPEAATVKASAAIPGKLYGIAAIREATAATRPTRMPAPLLGANAYEAAAASLPFTPAN